MNKSKPHLMLQSVCIASNEEGLFGRTGQIKSCHEDGSFGVELHGNGIPSTNMKDWVFKFYEDELYFPNDSRGYNQLCFQ